MTPFAWTAATTTAIVAGWLVSTAPRVEPPPPPPPIVELLTPAAATARVEREVVEPMKKRDLGLKFFSRVGPTLDARTLRAVVNPADTPTDRYLRFRVEADRHREPARTETTWIGRIDRTSGAIELAPGEYAVLTPIRWRPAAEILSMLGK